MLYDPETHGSQLAQALSAHTENSYAVVCYCAAWCRTCAAFKSQFEALATQLPQHSFVWVDVEEHEALLIDDDLEDFPTVLVQNKKGSIFYGPLPPFAEHITRLLEQAQKQPNYLPTALPSFEQLLAAAQ